VLLVTLTTDDLAVAKVDAIITLLTVRVTTVDVLVANVNMSDNMHWYSYA
jgi:hypothetical protein